LSQAKTILLRVDARELATILAALRYHQAENLSGDDGIADTHIADIATDSGALAPLSATEVDDLCRRLNGPADGGPWRRRHVRRGHGQMRMLAVSVLMILVTALLMTFISGTYYQWLPALAAIAVVHRGLGGRR
jgi:hypothetical protein